MNKRKFYRTIDYLLIVLGLFLILDSWYLHLITFNYIGEGIGWLDPLFHHWMIGVAIIIVAAWDLNRMR